MTYNFISMKKKLIMMLVALMVSLSGFAQFESGKFYANASLSNINLSYNSTQKWHFGVNAKGGLFFTDNWMVNANVGYDHLSAESDDAITLGAGVRYYILQNGLFIGLGADYKHSGSYDDLMPTVQIGYAFFLSRTITLEPEVYYNQSLKSHSDYSGFGLRVGFGIYL